METGILPSGRWPDLFTGPTSTSDFLRELQNFLIQNNIGSIDRFRMRVEPTRNNGWALVVTGETQKLELSGSTTSAPLDDIGTPTSLSIATNNDVLSGVTASPERVAASLSEESAVSMCVDTATVDGWLSDEVMQNGT